MNIRVPITRNPPWLVGGASYDAFLTFGASCEHERAGRLTSSHLLAGFVPAFFLIASTIVIFGDTRSVSIENDVPAGDIVELDFTGLHWGNDGFYAQIVDGTFDGIRYIFIF